MDSNEYYSIIIDLIKSSKINSNYCKTVGRQLGVFNTDKKIKEYVISKGTRIYEDYEYSEPIKWTGNKNKETKINKNKEIQLPSAYIKEDKMHFLTDIPYGLALYYHSITKQQSLIEITFLEWLDFFTYTFFNVRIIDEKYQLDKVADTLFPHEIYDNHYFKTKKEDGIEENITGINFIYFKHDLHHVIYFKFKQRHLVFKKKLKKV